MKKYKVFSTFSGCGGSTLGYKLAGLNVIGAVEFVNFQAKNYILNNPNTKVYEADIRKLKLNKIMEDLKLKQGELDILDGSPPCASFSLAGARNKNWGKVKQYSNRKQRTDDLFFEYIRFIKGFKPKIFVAENVKGLVIGKAKGYYNEIFKKMQKCGYNVKAKIMNAKYYEVPQSRERVIFIGVRKDIKINPSFPEPINKIITVKDAIGNLIITKKEEKETIIKKHYESYKYAKKCKQGESIAKYHPKGYYFTCVRLSANKPSNTILQTGGCSGTSYLIHYKDLRRLTIREIKKLMSFPLTFKVIGTYAQKWEALSRSVPPNMMKHIAINIKKQILNKYYKSLED